MSEFHQSSNEQRQQQQGTSVLSVDSVTHSSSTDSWFIGQESSGSPEASSMAASNGSGHETAIDPNFCYRMNHKKRGKCIIFNNKEFAESTAMPPRGGSDLDATSVREIFGDLLHFDVVIHDNRTTIQMLQIIAKAAAEESNRDSDCLALVVLSHGGEGFVYGTNGTIQLEQLIEPLKGMGCPALIGKPKLIFIQACRGEKFDEGVTVSDAEQNKKTPKVDATYRIPTEADFLYAFSCASGYFCFRNDKQGSWFIRAIAKVFKEHATRLEIMQLLTRVNHTVAFDYESKSRDKDLTGKKQIPTIVSLLTKELYFTRNS